MGIAAGWYQDGTTVGHERWFDGVAWTEHTRPAGIPAPAPGYAPYAPPAPQPWYGTPPYDGARPGHPASGADDGPGTALHWLVPVGRSWQSILAGYLGLVGLLVWVLAPVAIGFGVWALRVARAGGHGTGRAVFGIVAGLAGTVFGLLALASYLGSQ